MQKILIIDDDIHINNMLFETLTAEGYSVIRAYSGTEAVLVRTQQKPDLILLDLMLPGLTGEELL
ncbi:MAG: response regulator, partial [Ruminococcus sp.]|nr:response regulator [Ruminococcus sp.]